MRRDSFVTRLRDKLIALQRSEDGVSAVEFALIAPVLAIALVTMADVGLALNDRMAMDQFLRAGAQAALSDPGEAAVGKILQSAAAQPAGSPSTLVIDPPKRFCACPENAAVDPSSAPACSATCAGSAPPYVYYRMSASTTYAGMIVPSIPLRSTLQVQIR